MKTDGKIVLSATGYHRKTSYDRSDMHGHGLDWTNQPRVFKTYPHLPTIPLPELQDPSGPYLSELVCAGSVEESSAKLDFGWLSRVIGLTHAVTARARHGGGDFYYRSVASAGALYPFELYVGVRGVKGLDDGLYHHSLGLNALTCLRQGNMAEGLGQGLAPSPFSSPSIAFFLTAIFYRSAWKYRDRAYRYHLLDTGHLAENLALALAVERKSFTLRYDFDDEKLNAFLGVDSQKEVCLAVSLIKGEAEIAAGDSPPSAGFVLPGLEKASQVSPSEEGLSLIRQIHQASFPIRRTQRFGEPDMVQNVGLADRGTTIPFTEGGWHEVKNHREAVLTRRSNRNVVQREMTTDAFDGLLSLLCWDYSLSREDARWTARGALSVGFLCSNVEGRPAGFYLLQAEQRTLSLASEGLMTDEMAHICLDQAWLANAAVHVVFFTNLPVLEKTWGPRGYRYAMMTAGRLGQRLYIGAAAMGFGCCGIGAFYDDEARRLLGLSEDTKMLYLVALGPVKR